jgi:hypothetical protein
MRTISAGRIASCADASLLAGLVISDGKKATYRGDGTVNDEAGYRFVLMAVHGDASKPAEADRFRRRSRRTEAWFTTTGRIPPKTRTSPTRPHSAAEAS